MAASKPVRLVIFGGTETLEILSAELFEAGVGGLVEEAGCIVVYPTGEKETERFMALIADFKQRSTLESAGESLEVTLEEVDPSWQTTWKQALRPEKISRSFTLRPTHCPPGDSRVAKGLHQEQTIWFEPDVSFGSGDHPTTRLAATWVEEYVTAQPEISCFDVGTGTGVLSLVAAGCGARSVFAVDIDEISVQNAKKNCELNVSSDRITVELGSANATSATFDLVLANINTPVLLALARDLCARVSAGGKLLLTGLLVEDKPEIEVAFQSHHLHIVERREENGWALLILRR